MADVLYWANDAISPGNLRLGSSLYALGLSWKTALLIITLGHFLMAIGLPLNGVVGTKYRVGTAHEVGRHARFHHHNNTITIYFHTRQLHQYEPDSRCD
jgi:hypothetical protein